MSVGASVALIFLLSSFQGCGPSQAAPLKYKAADKAPLLLALYEAWFGTSKHIKVGYSSNNQDVIRKQMRSAKQMGISGFVVDWYGDREPYIDRNYDLMQGIAAKEKFNIAMMYDEADQDEGATDLVIADLTMFHDTYLAAGAPGRSAYLTFEGRPLIFVFPHGTHTDWAKVRQVVDGWSQPPLLIQENLPGPNPVAFDGFYPWVNPGSEGWSADGKNWGENYLADFYHNMAEKYPDKMTVGGAWPQFDDRKASWSLNRRMDARCGQTYTDTLGLWKKYYPASQVIPFIMVQTWNDYEEGSQIETGISNCGITGSGK